MSLLLENHEKIPVLGRIPSCQIWINTCNLTVPTPGPGPAHGNGCSNTPGALSWSMGLGRGAEAQMGGSSAPKSGKPRSLWARRWPTGRCQLHETAFSPPAPSRKPRDFLKKEHPCPLHSGSCIGMSAGGLPRKRSQGPSVRDKGGVYRAPTCSGKKHFPNLLPSAQVVGGYWWSQQDQRRKQEK